MKGNMRVYLTIPENHMHTRHKGLIYLTGQDIKNNIQDNNPNPYSLLLCLKTVFYLVVASFMSL